MPRLSKTLQEQNHTVRDARLPRSRLLFLAGKVLVEDKHWGRGSSPKQAVHSPDLVYSVYVPPVKTKPLGEQPTSEGGSPLKQVPWKEPPLQALPRGRGATPPPASQAHSDREHTTSSNR